MEANSMRGTCVDFCPPNERKLRIREQILHFYELSNGLKNVPGTLVKSFSRSAAGHKVPKPSELRTKECLHKTIEYLLTDIITDKRKSYSFAYEFIFDRMRAIRQEIIIQKYSDEDTIPLLEPIIMFLAYSRYNLCAEPIEVFDGKICDTHLQECLKRVLCCYDQIDMYRGPMKGDQLKRRIYMESLYQVYNMGATEAIFRGLTLSPELRKNEILNLAFNISKNYFMGNLYFVLRKLPELPHIICALASIRLPIIRKKLFHRFSHAYSNARLSLDKLYLCRIMAYEEEADENLIADCRCYGLTVAPDGKNIIFLKTNFLCDELAKSRQEKFVKKKLKNISLTEMLLMRKL